MTNCTIIGVDTAKSSFALHGADAHGHPVLRKTCTRGGFLKFLAKQAPCTVALEVCGGSHHWGREIRQLLGDTRSELETTWEVSYSDSRCCHRRKV